ncbi:MAG: hypothetical protein AAGJ81_03685 [Verrucomicrobiota bacterium]
MLHSTEVYVWEDEELKLDRVTRQDYIRLGDLLEYVRVTARIIDGKPTIERIEHVPMVLK